MKNRKALKQTLSFETLKEKKLKNLNEKQKNKRENLLKRKRFQEEENENENENEKTLNFFELKNLVDNMKDKNNLKEIRKISCTNDSLFKEFFKIPNFFETLFSLLNEESENNQFEICWILTNISCYSYEECKILLNFLPTLFILFSNPNLILKEQICWIFGNLSIELEFKNILISKFNILNYLFDLLLSNNNSMIRISSWTLSNIYRNGGDGGDDIRSGSGFDNISSFKSNGLLSIPISKTELNSIIKIFKNSNNIKNIIEITWLLSILTGYEYDIIIELLNNDLMIGFMKWIHQTKEQDRLLIPLIRILGNIMRGPNEIIDKVLNDEIFQFLYFNLKNSDDFIKKEVLWVISNISGGNLNHLNFLLKFNFINLIQEISSNILKKEIMNNEITKQYMKIEICYFIMNCSISVDFINLKENFINIFNQDIIQIFNQILILNDSGDDQIQLQILKFLISLTQYFQSKEMVDKFFIKSILQLKNHENSNIIELKKRPANPNAFAKSRADNVRVSFKNTRNVATVLQGMSLRRSKKFLNNVLRHSEGVPLTRFMGGRGRHAQAKNHGTNICSFPTKSVYTMLKILRNAEANAKTKGLEPSTLFLSHVQCNRAPPVRRRTFRAHGRIGPYQAHPSHIEVILSEKPKITSKPEPKE
eukprot:gene2641-3838_t